jgi:hypothetical protein
LAGLRLSFGLSSVIGTLAELAALPGMPSEPTLRRMIDGDPEFAGIIKRANGKGDAFEIDLPAAARYVQTLDERKREAERARLEQMAQLGLELGLGSAAQAQPGLTVAERKALLEEELVANKLARLRGELVAKSSVEDAIGQLLVWHRQQSESFSARLGKRVDLPRSLQIEIDTMMNSDLAELARRMRTLAEVEPEPDGDAGDLAGAAVEHSAV